MNTLNSISQIANLLEQILIMILSLGGFVWGFHKLYLSAHYQTKKDSEKSFEKMQSEFHHHAVTTSKDMQRLEKENEVFKTQYKGDMDLLKLQNATQHEMLKDLLHKVNNIANIKYDTIIKMMVEEEIKNQK